MIKTELEVITFAAEDVITSSGNNEVAPVVEQCRWDWNCKVIDGVHTNKWHNK